MELRQETHNVIDDNHHRWATTRTEPIHEDHHHEEDDAEEDDKGGSNKRAYQIAVAVLMVLFLVSMAFNAYVGVVVVWKLGNSSKYPDC